MFKRSISLLLVLCMLISIVPARALAEETEPVAEMTEMIMEETVSAVPETKTVTDVTTPVATKESADESEKLSAAEEESSGTCGDNLIWTFNNGVLTISGTGAMSDYDAWDNSAPWSSYSDDITAFVLEYGITHIGDDAFNPLGPGYSVTEFIIPNSVISIGEGAFDGLSYVTTMTIPSSVTTIEGTPFAGCGNMDIIVAKDNPNYASSNGVLYSKSMTTLLKCPLKKEGSFTIPDGVTEIGDSAFSGSRLMTITMPETLEHIGESAFFSCDNLTSILIPDSVKYIGDSAFDYCGKLESIFIPANVEFLGYFPFECCENLREINVDDANQHYSSKDGVLFDKSGERLMRCPQQKSGAYTIPDGVTTVEAFSFKYCDKLTSVFIPDSVTSISSDAFRACNGLTEITIPGSVIFFGLDIFHECTQLKTITLQEGITQITNGYSHNQVGATSISLPSTLSYLGNYAMTGCYNLKSITLPENVYHIGNYAFSKCTNLRRVEFPASVRYLKKNLFYNCTNLDRVVFKGDVPSFDDKTFSGVTIEAYYPEDNATWTEDVLQNYGGNITWVKGLPPAEVTSGTCGENLTWTLNDGTLTISGTGAMDDYDELTPPWENVKDLIHTVKTEEGVISIGNYAFFGLPELKRIRLSNSLVSIGTSAFGYCNNLINVTIPKNVKNIGSSAFATCDYLMTVNFLGDDYSIGSAAFWYCNKLDEIHFWGDAPQIAADAFKNVTAIAYYPPENDTWTEDMMQDYSGTLTWKVELASDDPCLKKDLTDLDYLAFSAIAYLNLESGISVKENLVNSGCWNEIWSEAQNITYAELCAHIAPWKVTVQYELGDYNGFNAVAFKNATDEVVIAYRGSVPPDQWGAYSWDAICDWLLNDIPAELGNSMGSQFDYALEIYDHLATGRDNSKITVTGHSLGGAWANTVSAYSGCEGVTFNSVSILDVLYKHAPAKMAKVFEGVDKWNFIDHTNQYDILAGMFEHYISTEMKPYIAHKSNVNIEISTLNVIAKSALAAAKGGLGKAVAAAVSTIGVSACSSIAKCHGLDSIVVKNSDGSVSLTSEDSKFIPQDRIVNYMLTANHSVDFGSSKRDRIDEAWTLLVPRTSYGGNGDDVVLSSWGADSIIGGADDTMDELDGSWGDDTYYYYIGDGYDIIRDVSGKDTLEICGVSKNDTIDYVVNDETGMVDIYCNDDLIVSICSKYRAESDNSFTLNWGEGITASITAELKSRQYSSSVWIKCPVDVQIIDADGNVVYVLKNGTVGNYYTDYGNFYVYQEENGGYGKIADLIEGYTVQIVGVDTGTMDIVHQNVVNGELSEAKVVEDIPVSASVTATIKEKDDGKLMLVLDTDDDGIADTETAFVCGDNHTYADDKDATCDICGYERQIAVASVPVYRLYNPYTHEHLLTGGTAERDALISVGWSLDGLAWHAPETGIPVYRLYNPYDDWHTYTTSESERDTMMAAGWTLDGAVSCSAPATGRPIYRLFNPYVQTNFHMFTASIEERDMLVNAGWILEGIAWYALK